MYEVLRDVSVLSGVLTAGWRGGGDDLGSRLSVEVLTVKLGIASFHCTLRGVICTRDAQSWLLLEAREPHVAVVPVLIEIDEEEDPPKVLHRCLSIVVGPHCSRLGVDREHCPAFTIWLP